MIDLHCHILPGMDDGAFEIQDSIEMARIAAKDGIKKIVATPHVSDDHYSMQSIMERTSRLNQELIRHGIAVDILPGAEINALMPASIVNAYTINQTRYALIEFPFNYLPLNANEIIFELLITGLKPIIAHPERNLGIIRDPQKLFRLLNTNVYVQITADSLTGLFGRTVKKLSVQLLKKGVVDVMASDSHSPAHRSPTLSKALLKAEKLIGKDQARDLVFNNPEAIIEGRKL